MMETGRLPEREEGSLGADLEVAINRAVLCIFQRLQQIDYTAWIWSGPLFAGPLRRQGDLDSTKDQQSNFKSLFLLNILTIRGQKFYVAKNRLRYGNTRS
jgi:hypothetical protein